jgi:3-deoxy-7-phosphoheptulonate synthase
MEPTHDLHIKNYIHLMEPQKLVQAMPLTEKSRKTVVEGREAVKKILARKENRLLAIVGPCSIHDENAAIDYATRLNELRKKVSGTLEVIMRVYFEKPRTNIGWKGLINDPCLDGSCDISEGLQKGRRILSQITGMGLPTATEFLDPITPQYVADLVSWAAVGARTTESQTHREMASGLSMPVGFKNSTDGNLAAAVNAILASRTAQSFLGIDGNGRTCVVQTTGNPFNHVVLRGGKRANYDPISIEDTRLQLIEKDLPEAIIVDCAHANSRKKYQGQPIVFKNVVNQYISGTNAISGLMLESNLAAGNQKYNGEESALKYGVSITDECVDWETTENLLMWAHDSLRQSKA